MSEKAGSSSSEPSHTEEANNSVEENKDNPEDDHVTLVEICKEHEDAEMEALAVLGASDEKNCTYSKVTFE